MNFTFDIQNLGNIQNASIDINPFTIIAGENSSGKSFVTKSLYSILDALNNDYVQMEVIKNIHKFRKNLDDFSDTFSSNSIAKVDEDFLELFYTGHILFFDHFFEIKTEFKDTFIKDLKSIQNDIVEYKDRRSSLVKFQNKLEYLKNMINIIDEIVNIIENKRDIIIEGIESNLNDNFKKNYQITSFDSIVNSNKKTTSLKLNMDTIGQVSIDKNSLIDFEFSADGVDEIQKLNNIIYLDSPVYIKLRQALEKNSFLNPFLSKQDRYLKNYPLYIDNLYKFIDKQYIDESDFKSLSDEIQNLINGNLEVSKSGVIEYKQDNGTIVPLSLTAMGISNLGLIELLLKNNIINKGSFLIIDEPEAHLHPKWQVELVNILYKISKAGANVIIATHSIDMIKAVEVILNKEEDANELIALNKMPFEKEFKIMSNSEKIETILDDLSSPFYNLYMENII